MPLAPCAHCSRHVRAEDETCPFCRASLEPRAIERPRGPTPSLSRAMLVFGASVALAAGSEACGEPHTVVSLYGAPPTIEDAAPPTAPDMSAAAPPAPASASAPPPAPIEPAPTAAPKPSASAEPPKGAMASAYGAPPPPNGTPKPKPKPKMP
ncbi:MAG: hypothetical protein IPK71_15370 [Myxococcales bacterium]|nr:hypothetical protein [Myxococcales bacterium]